MRSVYKIFNEKSASEAVALNHINLKLKKGDFQVIIGANGSGKSTLLNAIAGNVSINSGEIILNHRELHTLPEHKRSRFVARVFQNPLAGTAAELSILDNFRLAALRTGFKMLKIGTGDEFQKMIKYKIAALNMGLENKLNQPIGTLSGGQRQALTLLMSVMCDLDILLLDEPTAALDPKSAKMIMEIAQNLIVEHELTAILITHNLNEALHYGNRLIHMQEGNIIRNLNQQEKENLNQQEILQWFDYF